MFHGTRIPQITYHNEYYLERKRRSAIWVRIDCDRFVKLGLWSCGAPSYSISSGKVVGK